MKKVTIILFLVAFHQILSAQTPFYFAFHDNEDTRFSDLCKIDDQYYALYVRSVIPQEKYESAIIKFDEAGELIQRYPIGGESEYFMSYFSQEDDKIILISTQATEECQSSIKLSRFDITSGAIEVVSNTPLCDLEIAFAHKVDGLDGEVFIDEYHKVDHSNRKNIWKVDENYNLSKVFDEINWIERISVDFSRKGYVRSSIGVYNFYDKNFNYRKQRYSDELHLMYNWRNTPFGNGLMLEYTSDLSGNADGVQLRLIDSIHLDIKHFVEVLPPEGYNLGGSYCALNTGYSITPDKDIWFSGLYNVNSAFSENATPLMVTRVDSNLNIICQHFIIDDNIRDLKGLRSFISGEVAVFGAVRNKFEVFNRVEDAFLLVFGENCESPFTTSSEDSKDIISISSYPNPTVNDLTIRVTGMDETRLRVEFFDRTGKTIDIHSNLSSSIQVHDYPPGQYFYRIMDQDRVLGVGSWVKQ